MRKSTASAPGKVILLGEHFVVYGTKAILGSIDKRIQVTSILTDEDTINVKSNLGSISENSSISLKKIRTPLVPFFFLAKKMFDEFNYKGGIKIDIESEIPPGVGLGSSSACCVAGAASISRLFTKLSKQKILQLATEAEKKIFKNTSGADCTVCTYGGIIEYSKSKGFQRLELSRDIGLVISNSKKKHSTERVVSKVVKFKEKNEKKFLSLLEKESNLIEEAMHYLKTNDLRSLGKAMSLNQNYLEEIGVSNQNLQNIINIANKTSFGSKITGAGDGGCVISLVDNSNADTTMQNLKNKKYDCFSVSINPKGLDTF